MQFLGPFHPQITHVPVVLIIVSLVFEIVGRVFDRDWLRKAALTMLVLGVAAAWVAVQSGRGAEHLVHKQGVDRDAIHAHEDMANLALWFGLGAVAAYALATRLAPVRGVLVGIALLCHLAAAVAVGVAAHRGGKLVFEHGAAVSLHGQPLQEGPPRERGAGREGGRQK